MEPASRANSGPVSERVGEYPQYNFTFRTRYHHPILAFVRDPASTARSFADTLNRSQYRHPDPLSSASTPFKSLFRIGFKKGILPNHRKNSRNRFESPNRATSYQGTNRKRHSFDNIIREVKIS